MPDTQRTKTDLLVNLFQDGQNRGVSAQDMRDLIESISPALGGLSITANAIVTAGGAGTFTKILGTSALSGNEHRFDDDGGVSNRLRYLGVATKQCSIQATLDFTVAVNNQVCAFKFWHFDDSAGSGAYLDDSLIRRKVGTGADLGALALIGQAVLDTNDYIEVHATNESGADNITVVDLSMFIQSHLV